jgi:YCII-related domain
LPYFLVVLQPVAGAVEPPDHEPFVDSLVARNLVLLGGVLEPPLGGADGAYVLSCASIDEARRLAAEDPLVSSGSTRADVVEWQLVGINPEAVDPALELRPGDIA